MWCDTNISFFSSWETELIFRICFSIISRMIILEWDNITYLFTYYCYYFLLLAVSTEEIIFDSYLKQMQQQKNLLSLKLSWLN